MRIWTHSLVCFALLVGCEDDNTTADGELDLFVIDENGDRFEGAALPFRYGGQIRLGVRVDRPGFRGSGTGRVFIDERLPETGDGGSGTFLRAIELIQLPMTEGERADGVLEGRTTLTEPRGGGVRISAEALGLSDSIEVTLVQPTLTRTFPIELVRGTTTITATICVDTSVASGMLSYSIDGAASASATSRPGSCAGRTGEGRHFEFKATSTNDTFVYVATLSGTDVRIEETIETRRADAEIAVSVTFPDPPASVNELPAAGTLVQFNARVVTNDTVATPVAGQPVQVMAAGATLAVIPSPLSTDLEGNVTGYFAAPSESRVLVQVVSGTARAEPVLLQRPTLSPVAVALRFEEGSDAAMGILPDEGTAVPLTVTVTRDGAPVGGQSVTFSPVPATASISPSPVTTGADGIGRAILVAPAGDQLVLTATTIDAARDVQVLRAQTLPPPQLTLSFPASSPAEAGMLAAPDQIVTAIVGVTRDDAPSASENVSLSIVPASMVTPSTAVTDAAGEVRFHFVAADVPELLIVASVGDTRIDRVLTQ